jgi:hypothetical protein
MTWSRRRALSVAAAAGLSACAGLRSGDSPALHIAPSGRPGASAKSWDDAADLASLPLLINQARAAGAPIRMLAGEGPFAIARGPVATLRWGGRSGAPLVVEGVTRNGAPGLAEIVGARASPWSPGARPGPEAFRLLAGADWLTFRNIAFRDVGLCLRVAGPVSHLTMEDCTGVNVRRFFSTYTTRGQADADLSHAVFRRCRVSGFSKSMITIGYRGHDVLIEDCSGDSEGQDGDAFAMGLHLQGEVHAVVIRRTAMRNCLDLVRHGQSNRYRNGDGFVAEPHVSDLTLEDCVASGCSDAGFDLKARGVRVVRCVSEDNKRNFRLWADSTLIECVSRAPRSRGGVGGAAHFWAGAPRAPTPAEVIVLRPTLENGQGRATGFYADANGRLRVEAPILPAEFLGSLQRHAEGGDVEIRGATAPP